MAIRLFQFLTLLLTAICLVPAGAHLAGIAHKIGLGAEDYLTVQQIYRGWALFGAPLILDIVALAVLAILLRAERLPAGLVFAAFVLIALGLGVFFGLVYPGNVATGNWTHLPAGWQGLRARWEYGHAINAVLTFIAFILLVLSVLVRAR